MTHMYVYVYYSFTVSFVSSNTNPVLLLLIITHHTSANMKLVTSSHEILYCILCI